MGKRMLPPWSAMDTERAALRLAHAIFHRDGPVQGRSMVFMTGFSARDASFPVIRRVPRLKVR